MRHVFRMLAVGLVALGGPAMAQSPLEAPAKALGECFVAKSTGEERVKLARWIAAGMLASEKVRSVAQLAPGVREQVDRDMAAIFTRLTLQACLPQSKQLYAIDATGKGFEIAGEALGRIAMTELMSEPATEAAFGSYVKYLDEKSFDVLKAAK